MSSSVASEVETPIARRGSGIEKVAAFAAKLLVTAACFWYVSRQIDFAQLKAAIPQLDFRWAALGVVIAAAETPLMGLRWYNILAALGALNERMTHAAIMAVAAIGIFFVQVLPSVAGEGVRAWLLVRLGGGWRNAVTSVVLDRGIGVVLLLAIAFVALLLPSSLAALGHYRLPLLIGYGAALLAGAVALALVPRLAPLLRRWRLTRWIAALAEGVHRVLIGPRGAAILGLALAIHALTILIVWLIGRAQGLPLSPTDAAVLFTIMVGVGLVPISIGGWGLREVAVIALLGRHGVPPEQALLFSVCFGLVVMAGALPGALVWLVYSVAPARMSARSRASSAESARARVQAVGPPR